MNRKTSVALLVVSVLCLAGFTSSGRSEKPRVVEVDASRYAFAPNEITVKKGEDVELVVKSKDVSHGLLIEPLGVRLDVPKGGTKTVKLNTDTVGDFEGKCAHFCGSGHGSMQLMIHVVE